MPSLAVIVGNSEEFSSDILLIIIACNYLDSWSKGRNLRKKEGGRRG